MSIIKFINKITGTDKELSELEVKAKELELELEESRKYSQALEDQAKDQESEINNIKGQGVMYLFLDLASSKDEIGLQVARFIKTRGLIPELTYCCVSYCEIANAFKIVYKKNTPEEKGIKFNF